MFSGIVLVDGHPERSLLSTEVRPSLKHFYHKKVLLWLMALSPKASCSILWVSAAAFFLIETKFGADSLLLKISHISCKKKFAGSLKHNLTKGIELIKTSSQLHNWWHTDSQSVLLATSSSGRAYDNQFGRPV